MTQYEYRVFSRSWGETRRSVATQVVIFVEERWRQGTRGSECVRMEPCRTRPAKERRTIRSFLVRATPRSDGRLEAARAAVATRRNRTGEVDPILRGPLHRSSSVRFGPDATVTSGRYVLRPSNDSTFRRRRNFRVLRRISADFDAELRSFRCILRGIALA